MNNRINETEYKSTAFCVKQPTPAQLDNMAAQPVSVCVEQIGIEAPVRLTHAEKHEFYRWDDENEDNLGDSEGVAATKIKTPQGVREVV